MADCENIICHSLDLNYELCKVITNGNGHTNVFPNGKYISMTNQPNAFTLLPHDLHSDCLNLEHPENYMYIKQGSDIWHKIHSKAKITGSTFGKAIGLDGLKKQKEHHYEYILGKHPCPPSEHVQAFLDHGRLFEKYALATLVGAILPALMPPCYSFF